ncbi:MAG: hypothetical protein QG568_664, partial [Patescibacteria group bacterium]|nr:hypothetical protein [Patescibacteria group bacterium]
MTKTKDAAIPEISNEELELAPKNDSYMGKLLFDTITPPPIGVLVEGSVIAIDKKGVFIDLKPYGTGIIFGREYVNARDIIRKVNV